MAPRTAKAKKAADVKVAENDAPKKGRGKAKNTEETEQEVPEVEIDEKPALIEKKTKRGKKAQENGDAQTNGTSEDAAPPAKRGKKKKEVKPEESSNGDHSADEETPEEEKNGDHTESNGTKDAPAANGKGRKKAAAKKEEKPKENARSRKAKQASPDEDEEKIEEDEKIAEEKPKGKGRGRKPKAEAAPEPEDEKTEEKVKPEPAAKGRSKGAGKAAKNKSPEPEPEESSEEAEKPDEPEEKPKAPKKEPKGRKGKKAQAKEDGDAEEKEPASKKRKVNKKEEKGQGDAKEEDATEDTPEETEEPKPKGKRGKKEALAPATSTEADEESADSEASTKRRRKPTEEKAPAEDSKKKAPAKNKTATNYDEIDFSNHSKNPQGKEWNFKISCWNVDGIRAWMNKGGLDYIKYEKPDILCLQETKCAKEKLPEELVNLPGYHGYWVDSDKDGYAGVGLYTTKLAMNVQYGLGNEELDDEGRIITAEYEQFYLICTYVPNAGRKLVTLPKRLQWNEAFQNFVKELDKKKPVIICGDMNVAHNEIDLANPKANRKNAGFTDEERAGMTSLLGAGFVDTYRHFRPDDTGAYTFWTYMMNARANNKGWRLDYFLVSERLLPAVCDNVIRSEVYGSDHCPISLFLHITTADKPKEA